jgi:hypothetical protein
MKDDSLHAMDNLRPIHIGRTIWIALAVVVGVAVVVCALGAGTNSKQFFFSYLTALIFAVSLGVGALFWIMLHHLSGATWSVGVRRQMENLALCLLPLALLFIPIAFGLKQLYEWAETPGANAVDALAAKRAWLNAPRFVIFMVLFLGGWCWMAFRLRHWSVLQDSTGDANLSKRMHWHSPTGMMFLAVSTTFAAFDWIMSLEPHWTSTMFGVYFWAGSIVGSMALLIVVVVILRETGILRHTVTADTLHDLGKLLFAFVIFWAYIAFCQYFLIWYANVKEETPWYLHRLTGSWRWFGVALPLGHFIVPFLILLRQDAKRRPWLLGFVAAWVLLFHYLDLYWQIMPVLHWEGVQFHGLDVAAVILMCAVVATTLLFALRSAAPAPVRDPHTALITAEHGKVAHV